MMVDNSGQQGTTGVDVERQEHAECYLALPIRLVRFDVVSSK